MRQDVPLDDPLPVSPPDLTGLPELLDQQWVSAGQLHHISQFQLTAPPAQPRTFETAAQGALRGRAAPATPLVQRAAIHYLEALWRTDNRLRTRFGGSAPDVCRGPFRAPGTGSIASRAPSPMTAATTSISMSSTIPPACAGVLAGIEGDPRLSLTCGDYPAAKSTTYYALSRFYRLRAIQSILDLPVCVTDLDNMVVRDLDAAGCCRPGGTAGSGRARRLNSTTSRLTNPRLRSGCRRTGSIRR